MYDSNLAASVDYDMKTLSHNSAKSGSLRQFVAIKEHLYSDLNDEAVILSMATGKYYGLNPVGVSIWKSIQKPATLEDIETAVLNEYDVDENTCRNEVAMFLQHMTDEQLVEVLDEKDS